MLILSPFNLELLSTEANRAAQVRARTLANTLKADLLDSECAALIVSGVCCKRTGYRVKERERERERSEHCGGRTGGVGEKMKDQNKSGQRQADRRRQA